MNKWTGETLTAFSLTPTRQCPAIAAVAAHWSLHGMGTKTTAHTGGHYAEHDFTAGNGRSVVSLQICPVVLEHPSTAQEAPYLVEEPAIAGGTHQA